jgi:hypothetical protein
MLLAVMTLREREFNFIYKLNMTSPRCNLIHVFIFVNVLKIIFNFFKL